MEIIKNSLFCRFFAGLGRIIAVSWKNSFIVRTADYLHENYLQSNTKTKLEDFMYRDDPADSSVWKKFLGLIERLLIWFGEILEQSLFCKALQALRKYWMDLSERSLVAGTLSRLSPRRWLILAFAM